MGEFVHSSGRQVTLVVEHDEEIVYYSVADQYFSTEALHSELKRRVKKADPDPLALEICDLIPARFRKSTRQVLVDFILVGAGDLVISTKTEPVEYLEFLSAHPPVYLEAVVTGKTGLIRKSGIIPGTSRVTLRSATAYPAIFLHDKLLPELQAMSDRKLINAFNRKAGKGYMGMGGNISRSLLGQVMHSRDFDSSCIITSNPDGTICRIHWGRKVKLVNNRLEFLDD